MKKVGLMLRGAAAAALGLALVLPATTPPAHAEDGGYDYSRFVNILIDAFKKGSDGTFDPAEITELLQETIDAVGGAKVDVLAALDAKVSAAIYSQVEAAITKVPALRVPWLRGPAIDSIHNAAYLAKSQVGENYPDGARDALGKAMITLFTTLNTAYVQVDAEQAAQGRPSNLAATQRPYYRQGLETLISKMNPECHYNPLPEKVGYLTYDCTFNGKNVHAEADVVHGGWSIAGGPVVHISFQELEAQVGETVMRGTAKPIAQAALDELKRQGVGLP